MNFYIGEISKILDKDLYTVEVDVPGYQEKLQAFPKRGEVDEPRVGDTVVLLELDPDFHSYYLYEKLKENKFIGIRSRGKLLKMDEQEVTLGIYDPSDDSWFDDPENPDSGDKKATSYVKIDKSGNITVNAEADTKVTIAGKANVEIKGNATVKVSGKTEITGESDITVNAKSQLTITGGGTVKMAGSATPSSTLGPFNCIPVCPFSGAPHASTQISGV